MNLLKQDGTLLMILQQIILILTPIPHCADIHVYAEGSG